MSQFPNRPTSIRVYDPESPEILTFNSIDQEFIKHKSPLILYWKYNYAQTKLNTDELGKLYGEAEESSYDIEPITIYAIAEKSPILQELSRYGLTQIEEINFICNIVDIKERLGRDPEAEDLIRLSYLNKDQKHTHVFYKIASAVPVDDVLDYHVNYLINAEQVAMENTPDHVRQWLTKE